EEGEFRSRLRGILTKAIEVTAAAQTRRGGWGYVSAVVDEKFDESCATIAVLHGLRAARNAGIAVPRKLIDADYMRKCTGADGGIMYSINYPDPSSRPPITAAALSAGENDSELAKKWLKLCHQTLHIGCIQSV